MNDTVRAELKTILAEVQSGGFAEEWLAEKRSGARRFNHLREAARTHPLERIGVGLRELLPWLSERRRDDTTPRSGSWDAEPAAPR